MYIYHKLNFFRINVTKMKIYTVAIILSTLNGQRFIENQLNSLIFQKSVDLTVYWFDDGSTDNTRNIIKSFYSKLKIIEIKNPKTNDPGKNFIDTLGLVPSDHDYYAFCDQDDIWLKNKLIKSIKSLINNDCELYCSRTQLIDIMGKRIGKSQYFKYNLTFNNAIVQSIAGGNTMVWDKALHNFIKKFKLNHVTSHDWWLYILCTFTNKKIYYDNSSGILYRQHDKNHIGSNNSLKDKLKRLIMALGGIYKNWNEININNINLYLDYASDKNIKTLNDFRKIRKSNFFLRIFYLLRSKIYRQTVFGNISLIIGVILKKI